MTVLSLAIGIAGNITGLLVYASPIPTFWRVIKNKSTEAFSGVPYALALLSALQWLYFGVLKGPSARPVVTLTVIGFVLQAAFNSLYLFFATKSGRLLQAMILGLLLTFHTITIILTMILLAGDVRANVVGTVCAVISICFSASPLLILKRVIATRSVEFMPFYMTLFLFVNAATWLAFALLTGIIQLAVANSVNIGLAGIQLTLYGYYKLTEASMQSRSKRQLEEEDAATLNEDLAKNEDGVQASEIIVEDDFRKTDAADQASEVILVDDDVCQVLEMTVDDGLLETDARLKASDDSIDIAVADHTIC